MEQEVDRPHFAGRLLEKGFDLVVVADVERHEELDFVAVAFQAPLDPPPIPLAFVVGTIGEMGEAAGPALVHDGPRDGPGDRPVVGDAQNQSLLAVEPSHELASPRGKRVVWVPDVCGAIIREEQCQEEPGARGWRDGNQPPESGTASTALA